MDDVISRAEHDEFTRRMEDEHTRINRRVALLEESTKQLTEIAISVRELATSLKKMEEEQHEQSAKLDKLESRDGEMWRTVVKYIATAVAGIVIGFIFNQIGM